MRCSTFGHASLARVALTIGVALAAGALMGCVHRPGSATPGIRIDVLGAPRTDDNGATTNRDTIYKR